MRHSVVWTTDATNLGDPMWCWLQGFPRWGPDPKQRQIAKSPTLFVDRPGQLALFQPSNIGPTFPLPHLTYPLYDEGRKA
jgi:hypothetical protein